MNTPDYFQQARADLAAAVDETIRAEVRAKLANRPGLMFAAANTAMTVYLVTYEGQVIGELHHPAGAGFAEWRALPAGSTDQILGPFRTGREAATALLDYM